jgi:hypothetical protein
VIIDGMADPLTLAVLGTVAATEGVKFLYSQASDVLTAWRERRAEARTINVGFPATNILDAEPSRQVIDVDVVTAEKAQMAKLVGLLHPFATGMAEVDIEDSELARHAGELRTLLEAAYGQRITFLGEDRERTGARVEVDQVLGTVSGSVTGADASMNEGFIGVKQKADNVTSEGTVIGYKGHIGT